MLPTSPFPSLDNFRLSYRTLFEHAEYAVVLLDASDWRILEANSKAKAIFDLPPSEAGQDLFAADAFRTAPNILSEIQSLPADSGTATSRCNLASSPSAERLVIEWSGRTLRIADSQVIHFYCQDVTARLALENSALRQMENLEFSNRELNAFAHIASHDLQEPLRAIQAFGEQLDTKYGHLLDEVGRDYLARMRASASRMRVLIQDLATYSRVNSGRRLVAPVRMSEIAKAVISDLHTAIQESAAEIRVGELPVVAGDAAQLRQLLQNLLANAIKFRNPNSETKIALYQDVESPDSPAGMQPFARFVVEDNGIGFDQKYAERVFAPFQRLHAQKKYPGTGIGLAICQKIVQLSGGTIQAISQLGVGTKMIVTLPASEGAP